MTQTNQTYIEEKIKEFRQKLIEAIDQVDSSGFILSEDSRIFLKDEISMAFSKSLQDAIKYGEGIGREERDKEIARHLENTVMQHVTPEMEDKKLAIKMLKNIIDILKRAKLTTSQEEKI